MFLRKYEQQGFEVNSRVLTVAELEKIPKLMEIYKNYDDWNWRFGLTPDFKNSIEKKFQWALVDFQCNVEKGVIVDGKVFSDCLVPSYIEAINQIIATKSITYDVAGIKNLCDQLRA